MRTALRGTQLRRLPQDAWHELRPIWRWIALGIALRVLLSPLQHTWDSQTWWNVASELGNQSSLVAAVAAPYERMRELSTLAHGSGFQQFYEYWAYPPAMLLAWRPVARAYVLLGGAPLVERFAGPDTFTALPLPVVLSLGMKIPSIIADACTALLLRRLAGTAVAKWYFFNPYVLLIGAWTFDPVMVAFLLGGVFAASHRRWWLSGILLGLGAAVKFVPALLVPVVMLQAWRLGNRPLRTAAGAGCAAALAFLCVCAPWWQGVLYVLQFHATRVGGGMSWQSIWGAIAWIDPFADLASVHLYLSAQVGALTLSGCVLLAYWLITLRHLDLVQSSLVVILAYLAGSKLVNEAYPLPALALAVVVAVGVPRGDAARSALGVSPENSSHASIVDRVARANGDFFRPFRQSMLVRFLWLTPLAFAALNVPLWGFGVAPAEALGWIDLEAARLYHAAYLLTYQYLSLVLTLMGTGFQIGCVVAAWRLLRPRALRHARRLVRGLTA
ncbi:MAG: hypothetical protein JO318_15880 [Chloroflexi bacterium]|nr:hypothetical protein [Chloroflexota bacterium]